MKKYELIYDDLKTKILDQQLVETLPSEYDLCEQYNVGRGTIREAIKKLVAHGYCISRQGKGTYILPIAKQSFKIDGFKTFNETIDSTLWQTEQIFLEEVRIDKDLYEITLFPLGSKAYRVERFRICRGEKVIYDTHYFLKSIVKKLTKEIVENSIYSYLESELDIVPSITRENWTCEKISENLAKELDMQEYNLAVINRKHVFLKDGTLFEYTESYHRPDYFHMKMVNKRK